MVGRSGGVTNETKEACLEEMRAWIRLVAQTLLAEFPGFHVITAFTVFNVEQTSHAMEVDDEEILQHLKKICHTFDLCEDEMQAQLFDGMGRVQAIARQMEVENIRAWQIY